MPIEKMHRCYRFVKTSVHDISLFVKQAEAAGAAEREKFIWFVGLDITMSYCDGN